GRAAGRLRATGGGAPPMDARRPGRARERDTRARPVTSRGRGDSRATAGGNPRRLLSGRTRSRRTAVVTGTLALACHSFRRGRWLLAAVVVVVFAFQLLLV